MQHHSQHHHEPDAEPEQAPAAHTGDHGSHNTGTTTPHDHDGHDKHAGHDPNMFRRLFWWNLLLAIPVLVFSDQIQTWFGYSIDAGPARFVAPVIGTVIYLWGGQPFLVGGINEAKHRRPAMMLLIALAITVAYLASLASSIGIGDLDFWWELAGC